MPPCIGHLVELCRESPFGFRLYDLSISIEKLTHDSTFVPGYTVWKDHAEVGVWRDEFLLLIPPLLSAGDMQAIEA